MMELTIKTRLILDFLEAFPVFSVKTLEREVGLPERSIRMNGTRNLSDDNAQRVLDYIEKIQGWRITKAVAGNHNIRRVDPQPPEVTEKVIESMKEDRGTSIPPIIVEPVSEKIVEPFKVHVAEAKFKYADGRIGNIYQRDGIAVPSDEIEGDSIDGYIDPKALTTDSTVLVGGAEYLFEKQYLLFYQEDNGL